MHVIILFDNWQHFFFFFKDDEGEVQKLRNFPKVK
jgi:hypothetical protein